MNVPILQSDGRNAGLGASELERRLREAIAAVDGVPVAAVTHDYVLARRQESPLVDQPTRDLGSEHGGYDPQGLLVQGGTAIEQERRASRAFLERFAPARAR